MRYLPILSLIMIPTLLYCQESENKDEGKGYHRFTIMMANAHTPSATEIDGNRAVTIIPAWGLCYDYWFNERWAIGLHSDLFLQQFKIEKSGTEQTVERSYPISVCLMGLLKLTKRLSLLAGGGREFEKHEDFNLISLGTEYGFELPNNWELGINLVYEGKIDAYDTWMFGLSISKVLIR